jgi:hypothetical protein
VASVGRRRGSPPKTVTEQFGWFLDQADRLSRRRLMQSGLDTNLTITAGGGSATVTWNRPDEEEFQAFLVDLRPFISEGEPVFLRRVYNLIELHITDPELREEARRSRNLAMNLDGRTRSIRFLIRDRDAKFSGPFDAMLRSEGMRVIRRPIQAPNANAYAERVIATMRAECLDWTLIWGRRHLDRTLRISADHYNRGRPHRALGLASPLAAAGEPIPVDPRDVRRRDLLGGLIHEYHGAAA